MCSQKNKRNFLAYGDPVWNLWFYYSYGLVPITGVFIEMASDEGQFTSQHRCWQKFYRV